MIIIYSSLVDLRQAPSVSPSLRRPAGFLARLRSMPCLAQATLATLATVELFIYWRASPKPIEHRNCPISSDL